MKLNSYRRIGLLALCIMLFYFISYLASTSGIRHQASIYYALVIQSLKEEMSRESSPTDIRFSNYLAQTTTESTLLEVDKKV